MATYFVGDLQGCYDELQLLLERVDFNPTQDKLYLVGDLVARGDKSLECLRFVKSLGNAAQTVLGNHDLHLIATTLGIKKVKPRDRVDAIFNAPDFDELIHWLRHQPLLVHNDELNFLMAHAGISPDWDLETTKSCAAEVELILQQGDFHLDHRFDFACKSPLKDAPAELTPWFNLDNPLYKQIPIVFGHWASLVDEPTPPGIYALDTGCVWNNRMTLLRWEDKQLFTQSEVKNYSDF